MKTKLLYSMKTIKTLFLFIISVTITSCVSIDTTSYSDPDFISKQYTHICIYSVEQNLNRRAMIERVFVEEFKDAGITAVQGSYLFPPTREWEEKDYQGTLKKNGFTGFLKIEILDEVVNETVVPRVQTSSETQTVKKKNGKDVTVTNTDTYVTEDRDIFMNNQFQAELIDVETNRIAWKGFASTSAQLDVPGIDIETIMEKFAESVMEELEMKGHLKK